jgi:xylulokinase
MALLLGIDIGTSSAKCVLFDVESATVVATAGREYALHKPQPDRAEQNPQDWWLATVAGVRQVLEEDGCRGDAVAAISFSGQMHGTVLLDDLARPLGPAIIWADQRSGAECDILVRDLGRERYAAIAGTLPAAGFQGASLLWLARHAPEMVARARQVVLPKDYVRLQMTGEIATDASDAAGTGLFDVTHRCWAGEILAAVHLPEALFPPVLDSTDVAGRLTNRAAAALGLVPGIPVVAGCADQPAQALGNGLVAVGRASVTTGSGGQVFIPLQPMVTDAAWTVPTDPRLHVFNHAVPDTWYVLGAILAAGLSLRWLRDLVGLGGCADAYAVLGAEAAGVAPGADGLLFLPYLSGERTPHMDPLARGSFVGLNLYHSRGHLARAVMEGVAFALRQALEIGLGLGGQVDMVIAAGGGAGSGVWRQIQADIFNIPLQRTLVAEQAGLGAALLAGVGSGIYQDLAGACVQVVRYGPVTNPDPIRSVRYDSLYARFVRLYPRLADDLHWLAGWK